MPKQHHRHSLMLPPRRGGSSWQQGTTPLPRLNSLSYYPFSHPRPPPWPQLAPEAVDGLQAALRAGVVEVSRHYCGEVVRISSAWLSGVAERLAAAVVTTVMEQLEVQVRRRWCALPRTAVQGKGGGGGNWQAARSWAALQSTRALGVLLHVMEQVGLGLGVVVRACTCP